MTREITLDDIESLAVGAWILGTGGGGSPYLGLLNMRRLYAEGHRVTLMSPLDLADDDRVAADDQRRGRQTEAVPVRAV